MKKAWFDSLRFEWKIWLPFSISIFFVASILMSGWPNGLIPNLHYPYTYRRDGLLNLVLIQKVIEGAWIFYNPRLGFPFGSNMLDFPIPDVGSLIILKTLGTLLGSSHAAYNLFFLLGFPVTFLMSYIVLRMFDISWAFSVAAALLFVLLPFHFQRVEHLYYTWYFVVPIFFYLSFKLFDDPEFFLEIKKKQFQTIRNGFVLFFLGFWGVYYAFFGALLFFISAFSGTIKHHSPKKIIVGIVMIALVFLGVLVSVAPNIQHKIVYGDNLEVAQRQANESEIAGLKLVQLLLPHINHRLFKLRDVAAWYGEFFPLVNENQTSALGLIGAIGFLLLLFVAFLAMCGQGMDSRLIFLSITTVFLFLFATVGGFSVLFAIGITPFIRSWNRISVFIGFSSIVCFFLILQIGLQKYRSEISAQKTMLFIAIGLIVLGFFDQTYPISHAVNKTLAIRFEKDREFVKKIEALVPPKAGIYQMPYMPFPESSPIHDLRNYEPAIGFLHSHSLRWSYGAMRGRDGDLFFRRLANETVQKQIEVITKLGFSGILIDQHGFEDHGRSLEEQLRAILGAGPQLESEDGRFIFFKMSSLGKTLRKGLR